MSWIATYVRPIIELLYFFSGIILAGSIVIGLRQIKLVQEQIEQGRVVATATNKRLAVEKSIEFLNWFTNYSKSSDELFQKMKEKEIKDYSGNLNYDIVFDDNFEVDQKLAKILLTKWELGAFDMINQLEYYSAAHVSGLCDEEISFITSGRSFCDHVEKKYYDLLCYLRGKNELDQYSNIVELYKIWKLRLRRFDLENKQKEINRELSNIEDNKFKPIGV